MRRILPIILLVFLLGVAALLWFRADSRDTMHDGRLRIHVLDVGQGDCILIQTPDGRNMLVDGGDADRADDVIKYMRSVGVGHIDLLVITHPGIDHIGGLPRIMDRFGVSRVLDAGHARGGRPYLTILETVESRKINYILAQETPKLDLGNAVSCAVLWPPDEAGATRGLASGARCIVMRLEYKDVSLLLTGDIQSDAEGRLLATRQDLSSTILKVTDHGSRQGTSNEFLHVVRPAYAVVSVGKDNPHGHPARGTMERLEASGAQIYRTDEHGTVVFVTDGRKVEVRTRQ